MIEAMAMYTPVRFTSLDKEAGMPGWSKICLTMLFGQCAVQRVWLGHMLE